MSFYIFLLCLPTVLLTPVEQRNKVVPRLTDEARDYLKSMPSKFDHLLDEFIKNFRPIVQNELGIQAALAALQKPYFKEKVNKLEASTEWKTAVELGKRDGALFVHFLDKKPLDSLKDLAKEHPGVEANFSSSSAVEPLRKNLIAEMEKLVSDAIKLTQVDVETAEEELLEKNPTLKPPFRELEDVVDAYRSLGGQPDYFAGILIFDFEMREYLASNNILK
ncbi:hypothetical protein Trydic_g23279 [Trypoxylus dichotomus]